MKVDEQERRRVSWEFEEILMGRKSGRRKEGGREEEEVKRTAGTGLKK